MVRRVRVLVDHDHRVGPAAVVAYRAGWVGLVPEAHFAAAPEGRFEEMPRHGQGEPGENSADPFGGAEGGA